MKAEDLINLTDEQILNMVKLHVETYKNCSDCSRILDELRQRAASLLDINAKNMNIINDLTK